MKLENKFKEMEDHNNITGNDKKTMKFYDDMSACTGQSPKVTPTLILESEVVSKEPLRLRSYMRYMLLVHVHKDVGVYF